METQSSTLKIIVCGNAKGQIDKLFSRMNSLNSSSSGPFHLLFILSLFDDAEQQKACFPQLLKYIQGTKRIALPCYFTGYFDIEANKETVEMDVDGKLGENIYYLGKQGTRTLMGLQVAFFCEGFYVPKHFPAEIPPDRNGVDLLLTSHWPKGIFNHLPKDVIPPNVDIPSIDGKGSIVSMISSQLKPRYHFAGSVNIFFERLPYRNDSDSLLSVTRFIGLPDAFNVGNKKYVHALNLVPISIMRPVPASSLASIVTPSPFEENERLHSEQLTNPHTHSDKTFPAKKQKVSEANFAVESQISSGFNRWGLSSSDIECANDVQQLPERTSKNWNRRNPLNREGNNYDQRQQSKRNQQGSYHHEQSMTREEFPRASCWFCLSNPNVERHLVVSVGTFSYMALAKGGINGQHCIILPVEHVSTPKRLASNVLAELEQYKKCFRQCFRYVIFFEIVVPHMNTQHYHIQAIPVEELMIPNVLSVFQDDASKIGFELEEVPSEKSIVELISETTSYFAFESPLENKVFIAYIKSQQPPPFQLGRQVLCDLMNKKDRIDWKACSLDKEGEKKLAIEFKIVFKQYDTLCK